MAAPSHEVLPLHVPQSLTAFRRILRGTRWSSTNFDSLREQFWFCWVGLRHLRLKWTRKKAYRLRHHRSRYLLFGTAGAWADYVFAYDCRKQMNKEAVRRLRSGYTATCWDTKLKTETHYELEAGKLVPRSISGPSDSDFESKR